MVVTGEKQNDTPSVPHKVKNIETQNASTKQQGVTTKLVALLVVPFISHKQALIIVEEDGTKTRLGQEASLVPTP